MSREKLYGRTEVALKKPLTGQALVVFNAMNTKDENGETKFLTPKAWTELCGSQLVTRQDEYRVVLYYILIFKNRGLVEARDQVVEETAPETPAESEHPLEPVESHDSIDVDAEVAQ